MDKGRSLDKSSLLDKSRSTQRIEIGDTEKIKWIKVYFISHFSDKSTKIEKPKEIGIRKDDTSLSGMSRHVASVSIEFPYRQHILCKNKIKNTLDTLMKKRNYSRNRQPK